MFGVLFGWFKVWGQSTQLVQEYIMFMTALVKQGMIVTSQWMLDDADQQRGQNTYGSGQVITHMHHLCQCQESQMH